MREFLKCWRKNPKMSMIPGNAAVKRGRSRLSALFAVFALIGTAVFLSACGENAESADKLVMVTEATFPPYEFRVGREVVGVDIDIVRAVAKELGRELEIKDATFDSAIAHVITGKADIAASGITVTEERKKNVLFSIPYVTAAQLIIVMKDSRIDSAAALRNQVRIGVQSGTTGFDYVRNNIITDKSSPLLAQFPNGALAVEAMKAGKVDAVVLDAGPAQALVAQNGGTITVLPQPLTSEEYAIAVNKQNRELCRTIDTVIRRLKESGELQKIFDGNKALAEQQRKLQERQQETSSNPLIAACRNLWNRFADAFDVNFVQNDRWQYLSSGFIKTVEISFFAVLLGILLGFTVAVVRATHDRTGRLKFFNLLCRIYLTVIRGTPTVVQLLIIYFVILKSCDNKVLVAIIAFGVNSGAYVAEIIRGGIMSIEKGQFEAGHSLGLTYFQTMVCVILPQVFKNVLPSLGNEFIVLIKETSISGYIALQDLTKGGDIIRSQTYDAFMPLIAVALIYLACVMFLTWLLGILERKLKKNE